jgi:hypothetical protein
MHFLAVKRSGGVSLNYVLGNLGVIVLLRALLKSLETAE